MTQTIEADEPKPEDQKINEKLQRITAFLDFKLEDNNYAAIGEAISRLVIQGWCPTKITQAEDGKFVVWMGSTWGKMVTVKEPS